MNKLFKTSYKILGRNLLYIQPLLLYILIVQLGINFVAVRNLAQISRYTVVIALFLLTVIFIAGWMYINKLAVISYNPEDSSEISSKKSIANIKCFASGVGEYFVKFLFGSILFITFSAGCLYSTVKLCLKTYGVPTSFIENLNILAQTKPEDVTYDYLVNMSNSIPANEQLIITEWTGTLLILFAVLFFVQYVYYTSLIVEKSNFIVCIWHSMKFFFKNIFGNIFITFFALSVLFFFNTISIFTTINPILFTISFFVLLYFLNYYIILMLKYYYDKTQTDSNNGAECLGQDGSVD